MRAKNLHQKMLWHYIMLHLVIVRTISLSLKPTNLHHCVGIEKFGWCGYFTKTLWEPKIILCNAEFGNLRGNFSLKKLHFEDGICDQE